MKEVANQGLDQSILGSKKLEWRLTCRVEPTAKASLGMVTTFSVTLFHFQYGGKHDGRLCKHVKLIYDQELNQKVRMMELSQSDDRIWRGWI